MKSHLCALNVSGFLRRGATGYKRALQITKALRAPHPLLLEIRPSLRSADLVGMVALGKEKVLYLSPVLRALSKDCFTTLIGLRPETPGSQFSEFI